MKGLNHFLGLFFLTILVGMTSCNKQDLDINTNTINPASTTKAASVNSSSVTPILLDNAAYNLPSDFFTALNFTIEDEIIMLTTGYVGGCNVVSFRLVADPQVQYNAGNIPVFNGKLILDNNDKCPYNIKKTNKYDLKPLQQSGFSQVILNLDGFGEVVYSY